MKYLLVLTMFFSLNLSAGIENKIKHVIFIGIDGLGSHNLLRDEFEGVASPSVPNINKLKKISAWTNNAQIDQRNWSGPNWVGMITGSNSDEHGVETNTCENSEEIPTIYQIIKEQIPDARISLFYDWSKIKCHAGSGFVDKFQHTFGTSRITKRAIKELQKNKPTLTFVYYGQVDIKGHQHGGSSKQYKEALEEVDTGIGQIMEYLKSSGMDKDTLVILTADHGHDPTSGHHSSVDFPVPLFISGPGITPGKIYQDVRNNQVAAIMAYALGIFPSQKWSSTIENLDAYFL